MATGLLDFLSSDDAKLGIGLLAAGGYSPTPLSTGQRLQMAMQGVNADKQDALKLKLLQSQVDENASQNALRQATLAQQQKRDAYFMGDAGYVGAPASNPGAPGASAGVGGLPGTPSPSAAGGDRFSQWAAQYGIPRDALVNDYMTNGGKGIAEMLMKRGTPDMQVSNGYAYDKNKVGAGYLPQLNMSQDGKSSMVQIGPDGLPVVSAPRGAVETFGAYQGQAANYKPIKVFNPETQREEFTSEGAVVGNRPLAPMAGRAGNVQSPGYSGGDRNAANAESILVMQNELKNPALNDADRAGIQREIARMQLQSGLTSAQVAQAGRFAAGPSASETANNEAAKVRAVDTAKADVVRDTDKQKAGKMYGQISGVAQQAMRLLDTNPTGSGAGALADSALNFIGQPTKAGNVAQSLEAVAGWMVSNVPRMEGPQSNVDVMNYQTMAGRVGDRTLPVETRKAALREVIALQNKYAELNGSKPQEAAAPSSLPSGWSVKVK
ncbi:hypothetical protein J7E70_07765 [Variovorax paradoxus]|nr:hypothetical protein [Variovorax paradoxus]MBT2300359.1 hypothetical protein [Variovorax paradoxus]